MTMNDGTKVTTPEQVGPSGRVEMRDILEYYGLGHAPPPPGNVKGMAVNDELQNDGKGEISPDSSDIFDRMRSYYA